MDKGSDSAIEGFGIFAIFWGGWIWRHESGILCVCMYNTSG